MLHLMADNLGIYGFLRLNLNERANLTWEIGTYLHCRTGEGFNANLYSVEDFYVEVFYDNERNTIADVMPFNAPHLLELYLAQIDLSELLGQ